MTAENGQNGYWKGYPSYLLDDDSAAADASCASCASAPADGCRQAESYARNCASNGSVRAQGQRAETFQYQQVYVQSKNHIVAGLLAIFLGAFGIHKFFLGYNSTGITMLAVTVLGSFLTFGLAGMVMAVIGLVEGFIYLTAGQVAFDRTYVLNKKQWF